MCYGSPVVTNAAGDPFEALGDPNRRDILRLLSEGDKPVSQIAAGIGNHQATVTRRLPMHQARPDVFRRWPDVLKPALAGRPETGDSRRLNALDPGPHDVPAGGGVPGW